MVVVTYLNGFRNGFRWSSFLRRCGGGVGGGGNGSDFLDSGRGLVHRSRLLGHGYGSDDFGHFLLLLGDGFLLRGGGGGFSGGFFGRGFSSGGWCGISSFFSFLL